MARIAQADADEVVAVLKALADPVRLDLYRRIACVEEMSCTRLVADAQVSASTVSYHIKNLKFAGLVEVRKDGRNFFYTAATGPIDSLEHYLRHACP